MPEPLVAPAIDDQHLDAGMVNAVGENLVGRLDAQRHRANPDAIGGEEDQQRFAAAVSKDPHALALDQPPPPQSDRQFVAALFEFGITHRFVAPLAAALHRPQDADGRLRCAFGETAVEQIP